MESDEKHNLADNIIYVRARRNLDMNFRKRSYKLVSSRSSGENLSWTRKDLRQLNIYTYIRI